MESASNASKNVAVPMMMRVRTCQADSGSRSIRAATSPAKRFCLSSTLSSKSAAMAPSPRRFSAAQLILVEKREGHHAATGNSEAGDGRVLVWLVGKLGRGEASHRNLLAFDAAQVDRRGRRALGVGRGHIDGQCLGIEHHTIIIARGPERDIALAHILAHAFRRTLQGRAET